MSRRLTFPLAVILASIAFTSMASADRYYRDRYYRGGYRGGYAGDYIARDLDNRRDARRAAVVTGAVRAGIGEAAAEHRYQECMYSSGYNYDCEAQRYRDEERARRAGRRTAVVAGAVVRDNPW